MVTQKRREREIEEMRNLILDAAKEIITEEGMDKLSIRKIASRIEYSPAIIYHYFHDKEDVVDHVMRRGYQKIIDALSSVQVSDEQPEKRLKELTRSYIGTALQMSDEYKAIQLSSSPAVLEYTSSLFEGASANKPALKVLAQCLKEIYKGKNLDDKTIELTAQVITVATFGLIIKLIIEKDIGEDQRNSLIEHYIKLLTEKMITKE